MLISERSESIWPTQQFAHLSLFDLPVVGHEPKLFNEAFIQLLEVKILVNEGCVLQDKSDSFLIVIMHLPAVLIGVPPFSRRQHGIRTV